MKTLQIVTRLVDTNNGEVLKEDVTESASSWPSVHVLRRDRKECANRNQDCVLFEEIMDGFRRIETRHGMPDTWVVQEVTLR